ncbi:SLBB domain-containing protein [Pseudoalteromonas sp. Cnat2-41]|uniref:SLBB domain-containing protein n=1 Tax=unclassified Pseudoalteromonas TaxID=194690 RepID=UPI001EF8A449|nr:SLBB domain-containing protein [Pseudoalteromonas sp. CNAT2-18]MCF2862031.1 SLBB domain-containing protein [Pseudoalteromonas sp. CNAT2-18]MCG7558200.1 SLBB domain-containing protein [Pseudoalteromonas sp. CNAT2-18.1]
MKFLKLLLVTLLLVTVQSVSANSQMPTPTPEQIEQFKKLPRAQQEAIAQQYGISIDELTSQGTQQKQSKNEQNPFESLPMKPKEEEDEEDKYKPEIEELKPFGYELFAPPEDQFDTRQPLLMANQNVPVPDDYSLNIGDSLVVTFYGKENFSQEVVIDRDGRLALPGLSPVQVVGLTFNEAKKLLKNKIEREVIGGEAFVSIGELEDIRVMVLGEVKKPGAFSLPAMSTIFNGLIAAEGITEIGSLRHISLKRKGKTVTELDLYDLLLSGDSSDDYTLKSGDVIFVPASNKRVTLRGEVHRPAIYELSEGESFQDLMRMSGGLKADAAKNKLTIKRYGNNGERRVISVVNAQQRAQTELQNGDEVRVPQASQSLSNSITLIGAVTHPGHYQWQKGAYVGDFIQSLNNDLLPIADREYALIVRESQLSGRISILQFSPLALLAGEQQDVALQPRDKVLFFSRYESREDEIDALEQLAYTKEQIIENERLALWDKYQSRQFFEFIDEKSDYLSFEKEEKETLSVRDLLKGKAHELEDGEYSVFSRKRMLGPLLSQLNRQGSPRNGAPLINVNGEVRYPGVYPMPEQASVEKAIAAAGGLKESAFVGKVEVTRADNDNSGNIKHLSLSLADDKNSIALQSKDTVTVFSKPNWQENVTVRLLGEVKFPGAYAIRPGETLAEVLERAGGLTQYAFAQGAIFTREYLREQEQDMLQKLAEDLRRDLASSSFQNSISSAKLTYDDMDNLLKDLSMTDALGRMVIDMDQVVAGGENIELRNADTLFIPKRMETVTVIGEVHVSTSTMFNAGFSIDDYIRNSGGLKQKADEDGIYIIRANGSVQKPDTGSWFASNRDTGIKPGDTIVVPLDYEHMDNLTLWSKATQIVYQMGVAVAALSSL